MDSKRSFLFILGFLSFTLDVSCELSKSELALTVTQCGLLNSTCDFKDYGNLYLYCFHEDGSAVGFLATSTGADRFFNSELFNASKKLVIYSHGFKQSFNSKQSHQILEPLTQLGDVMVCAVDANRAYEAPNYIRAAQNTKCVGGQIAEFCARLHERKYNASAMHIIGHSLGGQASGYAARTFQILSQGVKVGRLTALDPAGPCFVPVTVGNTVLSTDATTVDVYHCNAGVYGTVGMGGGADFYPNCGTVQYGCFTNVCSHELCIKLYASSISNRNSCLAVKSASCEKFVSRDFLLEPNRAGYYWDGSSAVYYYHTNAFEPFCKGKYGVLGGFNIIQG